jgi:hypothetical protein
LFVPFNLSRAAPWDSAFCHAREECIAAAKDVLERTAGNSLKTEDLCLGDSDSMTECRDFRRFSRQVSGVYDTSFQSLFVFVCVLRGSGLLIQSLRDSWCLVQIQCFGHALAPCKERKKEEMLRITITNTATEEKWILYGRLVAPWVDELKASWKRARRTAERRRCIVNLDEVTFIDKCGERMLRSMSNQGAQFVASDVYVKHVLDRLKGKSKE